MDLNLAGRTALVTGASKGIGLAVAEALAEEGCGVILVSRTQEALDEAAGKLRARFNVPVATHAADLSLRGVPRAVAEKFPTIDILVNNAGAIPGGDLLALDEDRWHAAWDLKLYGFVDFSRAVYAGMKARKAGVILNIIGSAGERPDPGYIAGATANAGLIAFTRSLGAESLDHGVRVLGINPGPVATDRLITLLRRRAATELGDEDRMPELTRKMPAGRPATPAEIAHTAVFLVSPRSSYTSGAVLTIDGGGTFRR
jgi:NAD(P)-dependent dehydrogenase (short-subunit alcohol dehydrogenase family)